MSSDIDAQHVFATQQYSPLLTKTLELQQELKCLEIFFPWEKEPNFNCFYPEILLEDETQESTDEEAPSVEPIPLSVADWSTNLGGGNCAPLSQMYTGSSNAQPKDSCEANSIQRWRGSGRISNETMQWIMQQLSQQPELIQLQFYRPNQKTNHLLGHGTLSFRGHYNARNTLLLRR
jgi:hypothetical protein